MKMTRRGFLGSTGLCLAAGAAGDLPGLLCAPPRRHHMVLITLRGGYDSLMSVNPQNSSLLGDAVHCGYRAEERVAGSLRLFGPLIGGLHRHDADLCLVHGVRSDTTSHPDGLAMLARGGTGGRTGRIAARLGAQLPGDAPMALLDLDTPDGAVPFGEAPRPAWADLRAQAQQKALAGLGGEEGPTGLIEATGAQISSVARMLDETRADASDLDGRFTGDLGHHLRLAFQAIRGNWSRCINVASRTNWFDSHSDNDRFQKERQPGFFADLSTFVDLLKAHRNDGGTLFEQTTIAVFSEFGRFPRLNGENGKDHWPENSWILAGKGVRGGLTVGGTDGTGKGLPVSLGSGETVPEGGLPLFIDNGFATLFRIAGGDPTAARYTASSVIEAALALG